MFTREKLRKIFTIHEEDLTKPSKDNYKKVVMNTQVLKNEEKNKETVTEMKILKTIDSNKVKDEGVFNLKKRNNIMSGGNEHLISGDYFGEDNNLLVGAVSLRQTKTPIENINLHDIDFDYLKKNLNYKFKEVEEDENKENNLLKNSPEDTFHRAVGPILFIGQCFAIMPVMGVLSPQPKYLKFSFKSIQMFTFLFFFCSSSILTLTMLKHLLKSGINAKNIVGLVFFSCVQCSCYLFTSLATRWPKIMRYWGKVELIFTQSPYEMPKRSLAKRVRLSACVIIFCSILEHGFYLSSAIISYRNAIILCADKRNYTEEISFGDYVMRNYDYVFEILPYSTFVGIFILLVNGACTFTWNYMDLFIMMISKGVAYRFEQITLRINKLKNKEVPETVFIEIREHYVKMCELLEFIDENLSGIILLSCMNNLYFVCYQLLNVFNKLRYHINYIYFWYSLLYLIGRTAYIFLAAAEINDESRGGLAVLRKVSSRTWCVEVERLIFQMTTQTVALSGKKFYFLTRRLLFGMAGTIVTYELVLLQFDEPNRSKGLPDLCA